MTPPASSLPDVLATLSSTGSDHSIGTGAMVKALNEIGLEGIPKLMSNQVGSSEGPGGPSAQEVGSAGATGVIGETGGDHEHEQ